MSPVRRLRDEARCLDALRREYRRRNPRSSGLHERASAVLVDGVSHALRGVADVAVHAVAARGARIRDEDGHSILDFWQGHFGNILGHNPECVTAPLAAALAEGRGLQTGLAERAECELAERLSRRTGAERVRFTSSGSLATLYAVLLARAFTGRELIVKVGGGWHGAQPWGLKGVRFRGGFDQVETEGLSAAVGAQVLVTRFNDPEALRDLFARDGARIAGFIVEPFLGAGGFVPARPEYLREARRLTEAHGALLILDEVISGFRFRAGDAGRMFGVRPDLALFGKIVGGGMPLAAITGRADVMNLFAQRAGRVRISGGTFSAHPAALSAGSLLLAHLEAHEAEIYPRLATLGEATRRRVEAAFAAEGLEARCTGGGNEALPPASLVGVHFPLRPGLPVERPDELHDPELFDPVLAETVLRLALLLEDVHTAHGLGALSTAHTEEDLGVVEGAIHGAVDRIRPYLG